MSTSTALELRQAGALTMMPAMSVAQAVERYEALVGFVRQLMKADLDYGTIPGTDKKTLLKPGAEKLTTFFGLAKRFNVVEKVEDWTGKDHNGEVFFYYLYRCSLWWGDTLVAEADASANSFESKYRYRKGERICPSCNAPAILKSKNPGEGWFCWKKKSGCGATFYENDPAILSQVVGRVANPDVCDQVNTLQKMAQKRALVAATLLAVNASEFFTQDVEDMQVNEAHAEGETGKVAAATSGRQTRQPQAATTTTSTPSPVGGLDGALLAWAVKEKGERAGKAFYDGFLSKKSAKDKEQFAAQNGIRFNETDSPAVVEGEIVTDEIDAELSAALDELEAMRQSLIDAKMSPEDVQAEVIRLLPANIADVTQCTPGQIDEIIAGLNMKLARIRHAA